MATHPGAGRELIDELIATRRHAQRLFISLRFQGRDKEADQAEAGVRGLTERRASRAEDIAAALGRLHEALELLATWGL